MFTHLKATDTHEALSVPTEALHLAIDLDLEGRILMRVGADQLRVGTKIGAEPPPLSEEQKAQIRRWKSSLLDIVAYCES